MNTPITRAGDVGRILPLKPQDTNPATGSGESFAQVLERFVSDVNTLQNKASESIEKLATGEISDVHQVMIAVEEANTAMEFMLEIRNKIVEAYQEIMRMPV
ncbi:MAG: flagellar hook-basal body complex protein FliE [Candidatus Latescibacterota bacterium]